MRCSVDLPSCAASRSHDTIDPRMFLRPNHRGKDGKQHTYWSLVESVRTPDGPRQRTLCHLGELNGSDQARWLKTVEVFNEQGQAQQLKLFPSHVEVPADDPQVGARPGQPCASGEDATVWRLLPGVGVVEALGTGPIFRAGGGTTNQPMCPGRVWPRCWPSTGCARRAANWPLNSGGSHRRRWTICWGWKKPRSTTRAYIAAWIAFCRTRPSWNGTSRIAMGSCSGPSSTCCSTI